MKTSIGYVGRGEYRIFLGREIVGWIQKMENMFLPRVKTQKGLKVGRALPSLAAAKVWVDFKFNNDSKDAK